MSLLWVADGNFHHLQLSHWTAITEIQIICNKWVNKVVSIIITTTAITTAKITSSNYTVVCWVKRFSSWKQQSGTAFFQFIHQQQPIYILAKPTQFKGINIHFFLFRPISNTKMYSQSRTIVTPIINLDIESKLDETYRQFSCIWYKYLLN